MCKVKWRKTAIFPVWSCVFEDGVGHRGLAPPFPRSIWSSVRGDLVSCAVSPSKDQRSRLTLISLSKVVKKMEEWVQEGEKWERSINFDNGAPCGAVYCQRSKKSQRVLEECCAQSLTPLLQAHKHNCTNTPDFDCAVESFGGFDRSPLSSPPSAPNT